MRVPPDTTKMMGQKKNRIAFLGKSAHTIPSHRAVLERLSDFYDITVYGEVFRPIKRTTPYRLKFVTGRKMPSRLRELFFAFMIIIDHMRNRFDLIHAHSTYPTGFYGLIFSKIFKIPIVVSLDGEEAVAIPEINFGQLLIRNRRKLNRWIAKNADEVIVLTQFMCEQVKKNLEIDRDLHVIPRGVDLQKFTYRHRILSPPYHFLNVGYLNSVKDQETLIRAFAILNASVNCTLTHIGEDYSNGKIQNLVNDLGLNMHVSFKGFVPYEELPRYYTEADVLIHSSLFESQGLVVNEAMASGVLVCGTHVGLMADLSGQCCVTTQPGDSGMLAATILRILQNEEENILLRRNALRWSSEHNLEWTVTAHKKIYEALTKGLKNEA